MKREEQREMELAQKEQQQGPGDIRRQWSCGVRGGNRRRGVPLPPLPPVAA